jgi:hypothetical protein
MATTADVLNAAADLIEAKGWTQGIYGWGNYADQSGWYDGPLCIEGAILAAMGVTMQERDSRCPAFNAVRSFLELDPNPQVTPLYLWNDDLSHVEGKETVLATLRGAAVLSAWLDSEVGAPA